MAQQFSLIKLFFSFVPLVILCVSVAKKGKLHVKGLI